MDHVRNMTEMLQIVQHYIGEEKVAEFEKSCVEALRHMDAIGAIKSEIHKMESEVSRCYEIASQNAIYGLKKDAAIWNARGQAFRDCIEFINKCIGGT